MRSYWLYAYPQPDLDAFGCREDKPMVAVFTEQHAPFAHCAITRCTKVHAPALAAAMILPEPYDVFNAHGPLSGISRSAVNAR
jgi:hypothetical protein